MQTLKQLFYRLAQRIRRTYWRIAKPRTFGAKVLIICGDQFLLVKHSYEDSSPWTLPGGSFNPKRERVQDAAIREVQEELDLPLKEVTILGSYFSTAEYKRDTVYCLLARTSSRAVRVSPEIAEFAWFTEESIPNDLSTVAKKSISFWSNRQSQS